MSRLLALAILTLFLTACDTANTERPQYGIDRPFVSPPDIVTQSGFAGNQWRVEQILYDGLQRSFDPSAPVTMFFSPTGYINVRHEVECPSLSNHYIEFSDDEHFQTTPREGVSAGCKVHDDPEVHRFCRMPSSDYDPDECSKVVLPTTAAPEYFLNQTHTYEVIGDHLILRGGEGKSKVEMWFVMDNP